MNANRLCWLLAGMIYSGALAAFAAEPTIWTLEEQKLEYEMMRSPEHQETVRSNVLQRIQKQQEQFAEERAKRISAGLEPAEPPKPPSVKADYWITPERRELIRQITGKFVMPGLGFYLSSGDCTDADVLNVYPFLRREDGTHDVETVTQIRTLLNRHLEISRKANVLRAAGQHQEAMKLSQSSRVSTEIGRILDGLNRKPRFIRPTPKLLAISDTFERYDVQEMTRFLESLAVAQSSTENPRPTKNVWIELQTGFSRRFRFEPTIEQAKVLLATPLNELAIGTFPLPEDVPPKPKSPVLAAVAFNVALPQRLMLEQITGHWIMPGIQPTPGCPPCTMEDILELYPQLKGADGTINQEGANRLREQLDKNLQTPSVEASRAMRSVLQELERKPTHILATELLTSISPNFALYDLEQMKRFIGLMAYTQTAAENGEPVVESIRRVRSAAQARGLKVEITDEQAQLLLVTPLTNMAVGFFAK